MWTPSRADHKRVWFTLVHDEIVREGGWRCGGLGTGPPWSPLLPGGDVGAGRRRRRQIGDSLVCVVEEGEEEQRKWERNGVRARIWEEEEEKSPVRFYQSTPPFSLFLEFSCYDN